MSSNLTRQGPGFYFYGCIVVNVSRFTAKFGSIPGYRAIANVDPIQF